MQVRVDDLQKRYGRTMAVDVASLVIEPGTCFGLAGNNGAGKTTFFRLVLDLVEPTRGAVYVDSEQVSGSFGWRKRTGSYIDEGFLIDFLTPEEYFQFVGRIYGMTTEAVDEAVQRLSILFTDRVLGEGRFIRSLSTGNRKKVGIVAALLADPALLVLDEPFANLDPTSQIRLKELVRDQSSRGTTVLISSHDLAHVTEVCGRIALMESGRIIRDTVTTADTLRDLERYFAGHEGPRNAPIERSLIT